MAQDVPPAFRLEAAEQHRCRHPWDAYPSEPNVSDASDGARPDAMADGCPSDHPDHLADADVGKLAGRVPVVRPADACLAPVCWGPEPAAVPAPNTPGAVPSAEQSVGESAVLVLDDQAAQSHLASADAAPALSEAQASSELPTAYSPPERWARLA
jgi:hypothetical protein